MPSINTWKQLNAASGLAFGSFLVLHLGTFASLSLGWELAETNLHWARTFYQNPVLEILLVAALMVHTTSNYVLYMNRQKIAKGASSKKKVGEKDPPGTFELKVHRTAGAILGLSIFGHVASSRVASLLLLDDPSQFDYSFITRANELIPFNIMPVGLLVFSMAGAWHLVYGTRAALTVLFGGSVVGKPFPLPLKFLAMLFHLAMISAVAAVSGYYYVIDTKTKADLHEIMYKGMGMM